MLVVGPLKKDDVVTLKLLTGEEVIACFERETDTAIVISKPLVIAANGDGMGLIPWVMSSLAVTVPINKFAIIAEMRTADDVAAQYNEINKPTSTIIHR